MEFFPHPVFEELLVAVLDVLGIAAVKDESWVRSWQLVHKLDTDCPATVHRRGIPLYLRLHLVVEEGGLDFP